MQVENLEKNKVKLTFEVGPERFEEGLKFSYNKNKGSFSLPGFRKGKVPRALVEKQYGENVLYSDAINHILEESYEKALEESGLEIVSKPEISVPKTSREEGIVFEAILYTKPEVKVNNYRGLTYVKSETSATEDEIMFEIDTARKKNSRIITITDRAIKNEDIVTIDFKGYRGDEPFEGGEGKDYDLKIGSHTFIDTFEEQLIGKEVGDDVVINVTFPEEYHEESLKGQPARFEVEIKDIKFEELPEVNDELAQDVSEFDTIEEYKNNIKTKIEEEKIKRSEIEIENELMLKAIESAEMDVPQVMIDSQVDQMIQDLKNQVRGFNVPFETYLQYMGQTQESLLESYEKTAENQVKGRLVLEKIAQDENFVVSDEELEEEVCRMAETYKIDKEEFMRILREEDKESLKKDVLSKKALELIKETAIKED